MNEQLIIVALGGLWGIVQLLMSAILGWLAYEIRCLRHDVSHRIHLADCERRMNEHVRRIENLEKRKDEKE